MDKNEEKRVITELIESYKDFPCLWDMSSDQYKDNDQKNEAWEILVATWKTIEPDANVASVKKKIDNLKSSYKREVKKVNDSKRRTGSANEVHKPNLWYFDLMTFLDKKDEPSRRGADTRLSDNKSRSCQVGKKGRTLLKRKTHKVIKTLQDPLQRNKTPSNSFVMYVGEQLDSLSTHQRQIAEKLISDVLFLGKTENLNLYSSVESNNTPRLPSPPYITSSPQYRTPSPQYIELSPEPQYTSPSPQYSSPSPQFISTSPQSQNDRPIRLSKRIKLVNSPAISHTQTQGTVQSISSPSQDQTQSKEILSLVSTPTEKKIQDIDSSGSLLKELLTSRDS